MRRYLYLYKTIFKFALIRNMAYPQDFVIWAMVDLLWSGINLSFYKILLLRMPNISGWTFEQLSLILGLVYMLNAFVWGTMYNNMKELVGDIYKGNLDLYLSKPINSQFLVSTKRISLSLIPSLVTGIFLTTYGLSVNHQLTLAGLIMVLISIISSVVISYSLYFISVTCALFVGRLKNIADNFPQSLEIAKYPTVIYPTIFQFLFTFVMPLALLGYVPASIILGRINFLYIFSLPATGLLLLFLSHKFWSFALRHYSSASS